MPESRDYLLASITGFLTGLLVVSILFFFIRIPFDYRYLGIIVVFPLLVLLGIWFSGVLARTVKPFFLQFGKFAAVGFLSAAIDFFVLNLMSYVTGITAGLIIGWINAPGFLLGTLNAYLFNKLWVFGHEGGIFNRLPIFFAVTLIGLFLNSVTVILLTTYVHLPEYVPAIVSLNLAKIVATVVAMVWNFNGYKFLAFAEKSEKNPQM